MDLSTITGVNINLKPGQEEQKFGDMFEQYAASDTGLFEKYFSNELSISELDKALNDNLTINITTENGEEPLPSLVSAGAIFSLINNDLDPMHISTEEIDAFLEDSEYKYDDLAEMNLEDAVNVILDVGTNKFQNS